MNDLNSDKHNGIEWKKSGEIQSMTDVYQEIITFVLMVKKRTIFREHQKMRGLHTERFLYIAKGLAFAQEPVFTTI